MAKVKFILALLFFSMPAFAESPVEGFGLHLFSRHDPYHGENQVNQGAFVRLKGGWTAGFYTNSLSKDSKYIGWATPEWYRMRLSVLAVSGYKEKSVVVPVPSVKVWQFDDGPALWLSGFPIQVTDSRAVGHVHVEWSFK